MLRVGRWPGLRNTYRTIQAAVNAAHRGDRILIAAGDYHESPGSSVGIRVRTPGIVIEGVNRNAVIVDGTKPGVPSPCDPASRFQNFGPVVHRAQGVLLNGRDGIVVDRASGVTVENLTVCNFVGTSSANQYGNQLWFNGGAGGREDRPRRLPGRERDREVDLRYPGSRPATGAGRDGGLRWRPDLEYGRPGHGRQQLRLEHGRLRIPHRRLPRLQRRVQARHRQPQRHRLLGDRHGRTPTHRALAL